MSYATVEDLESRMRRPLTADERASVDTLLDDASVQIRAEYPLIDVRIAADTSGDLGVIATRVVCSMVKRALAVDEGDIGISQQQETTGPFSRSVSFSNPMGDLYLTKAEKRLLGGGRMTAGSIDTAPTTFGYNLPFNYAPDPTYGILPEVPNREPL